MPSIFKDLARSAWFLDYDGTLCPHLEVWEERGYRVEDISSAVNNLAKKSCKVMWNTGRRPESLGGVKKQFLDYSGYFIHGSVFWDSEKQEAKFLGVSFPKEYADSLSRRMEEEKTYRLEIKSCGARLAPFQKTQKKFIKKFVESLGLSFSSEWEWRIGDRGAELLHKDFTKGSAVECAYTQNLVKSDCVPVVAGDDLFDRAAMEYALANNGYAIILGEGCGWITEIPHKSSQVLYFREPRDFLLFLKGL